MAMPRVSMLPLAEHLHSRETHATHLHSSGTLREPLSNLEENTLRKTFERNASTSLIYGAQSPSTNASIQNVGGVLRLLEHEQTLYKAPTAELVIQLVLFCKLYLPYQLYVLSYLLFVYCAFRQLSGSKDIALYTLTISLQNR